MTYTTEPKGLAFINNLNSNSASSVVQNLCWLIGSITLTRADYLLLTSPVELARQAGLFLAGILVGAWTMQKVAGVMDANNKRKAHPEYATVLKAKTEAEEAAKENK